MVIAGAVALYQFAFRPSTPKMEVASKEKMAFPLPDKPSIAVLPFANMSDDPKQEYFATGWPRRSSLPFQNSSNVFVIARNSTFTYKGRQVKVQQVAEEMGVQYVLEGSVRKIGGQGQNYRPIGRCPYRKTPYVRSDTNET